MLRSDNCQMALRAWLDARGDALMPTVRGFGPVQMKGFLPFVAMFRHFADGTRRVTVHGTALCDGLGFDPTGMEVSALYASKDRDDLHVFHDLMFEGSYLSHSLRVLRKRNGTFLTLEQLLLPVADADGTHDRYAVIASGVADRNDIDPNGGEDARIGTIVQRTIYAPHDLRPVDCPATTRPEGAGEPDLRLTAG